MRNLDSRFPLPVQARQAGGNDTKRRFGRKNFKGEFL